MKKRLLLTILLLLAPTLLSGAQDYLEVTASVDRQLSLAVAPSVNLGGAAGGDIPGEVSDVLKFDLTLTGRYSVMNLPPATAGSGIRPGEFDFAPWQAVNAELLVKSGYTMNGDLLVMEFRLYDVANSRQMLAKRYSGTRKDLRRMTHTFADDVLLLMTRERGPFTGKTVFVSKRSGNKEIYLMDYDGHNVQKITANRSINLNPDFSPNGREILYTSYKHGNPDLYRRGIYTGTEARISSSPGINVTGAWSPDGGRIALAMSKDGNSEIYSIGKGGGAATRLTKNHAIDISPSWSPDGSRIAFVSDRLGKPQIFVMNSDGSGVYRLTTSGAYNVSPRWSPKGDRILYCRQQGSFQIYSITPDGSGDTQLTSEGSNEHPTWSPDGRFITFSSTRGGGTAIYVMRADGTGQTKVSRSAGSDTHPTWSPRL